MPRLSLQNHLYRFGDAGEYIRDPVKTFIPAFLFVDYCLVVAVRENCPFLELFSDPIISLVCERERARHVGRKPILNDVPRVEIREFIFKTIQDRRKCLIGNIHSYPTSP
jgi:hypothetical protein